MSSNFMVEEVFDPEIKTTGKGHLGGKGHVSHVDPRIRFGSHLRDDVSNSELYSDNGTRR